MGFLGVRVHKAFTPFFFLLGISSSLWLLQPGLMKHLLCARPHSWWGGDTKDTSFLSLGFKFNTNLPQIHR